MSFALVLAPLAFALAPPAEQPFPLTNATLKTDGARYYVEGRVRLSRNQTVTSLRRMTLVGRGENAVLEVSGKLEIKAATGGRCTIENLTIELMPDCKDFLLTEADLSGSSAIVTGLEGPANCEVYLQHLSLRGATRIELEMAGGQVDLQNSFVGSPVVIRGVHPSEKNRAKLKVIVLENKTASGGLVGGLLLEEAWDALVRNNDLAGERTRISNCRKLDFDGNNLRSARFELLQASVKDFAKTKVQSCDFQSGDTRIYAPGDPEEPEKLERFTIHTSWFGGETDADTIRRERVIDGGREEGNGMLVTFKKTSSRMRGLGGTLLARPGSR